jgi:hypothetical protein
VEKSYSLNIKNYKNKQNTRRIYMDVGAYFLTLEYVAMGSVFIALILIFLYAYYGKDEETLNE